jgi:hypothetical protein
MARQLLPERIAGIYHKVIRVPLDAYILCEYLRLCGKKIIYQIEMQRPEHLIAPALLKRIYPGIFVTGITIG